MVIEFSVAWLGRSYQRGLPSLMPTAASLDKLANELVDSTPGNCCNRHSSSSTATMVSCRVHRDFGVFTITTRRSLLDGKLPTMKALSWL
ncbi:hypothetical protein D3C81_1586160 [compost metagenome]